MISIIIIVKNDLKVGITLSRLIKIPKPDKTEIIVVDSSNNYLSNIKNKYSQVKWIDFKNRSKKRITIPEQRNVGIKASKGQFIVFIDSGCIPSKKWLINLYRTSKENNESIVSGSVINKSVIHRIGFSPYYRGKYLTEFATVNLLIKKEVFRQLGYFDENFYFSSDIDFSIRSIKADYKIRFVKEATVTHPQSNISAELKRSFWYGWGKGSIYHKYFNSKWKNLFNEDKYMLFYFLYLLYLLFLPLSIKYPIYLLLLLIPVLNNINKKNKLLIIVNHITFILGFSINIIRLQFVTK